jgi:hypothetical protein
MESAFILVNIGPRALVSKIDELLVKLFPLRPDPERDIIDLPQSFR